MGKNWLGVLGAILAGSALAGGVLGRNRRTLRTRGTRPGFCKSGVSGRNEKGELFFGFISATIK